MKRYPLKWFNIVFLMLASACVKANGEADGVTVAQRDEISVTILESGHIVVPVIANDAVGGSFIFDTGGGIELVSTCFYEKIKAQSTRAGIFTCFRSDGERVDVDTYLIPSLQIGQLTRRNVLVGVFPLLDTIGIDGILSCKFFESIAATIDFKNQTLTIEDERSIDEISKTGTIIPIFIQKLGRNGLDIFIDIWVNDRVRIFCEFDTGHGFYPLWMNSYYANRIQGNISPSDAGRSTDKYR
jgi:hypothetical protein